MKKPASVPPTAVLSDSRHLLRLEQRRNMRHQDNPLIPDIAGNVPAAGPESQWPQKCERLLAIVKEEFPWWFNGAGDLAYGGYVRVWPKSEQQKYQGEQCVVCGHRFADTHTVLCAKFMLTRKINGPHIEYYAHDSCV